MPISWSRQPGAALYTVAFAIYTVALFPGLLLWYSIPLLRPDRHWTYRQSLARTVFMYVCHYIATVELKVAVSPKPGTEGRRFVLVEPGRRRELYQDVLLCDPSITPTNVGAVWSPRPISAPDEHPPGQRVFLHLHGGAYVLGSARDVDMDFCYSLLSQYSPGCAIFCPEYRLASLPGGRFPAALQDAVTAYDYLITQLKIPPGDIVISGDSAGAHLALALLRYVNAYQDILPEPGAILLWSPWPDMSIDVEAADERPATHVDHVAPRLIAWTYQQFLPDERLGVTRSNPYLSPSKAAIPTKVPMWVQWGGAEVLKEDIEKFIQVQSSAGDGGEERHLSVYEVPHAPHDIFALAPLLGWKSQAAKAVEEAIRFLDK
ncbi:putative alpha beta hydrolase fold-3 domain-containing protein [Rosellinia necatrix]|uniref:Putative alpha beta hydrolase fold-3 domain-containing protein n=1 Tax=Rosellinia necatrix TaxID=77044 RepID=A0A1W2TCR6_ROSNE|nr:putative alpha beta hydrolase fold-3 domain-containing protein [Rosellinia necatrix]